LWLELKALDRLLIEPAPAGAPRLPRLRQPVVTVRSERPAPRPTRPAHRIVMRPAGDKGPR
jgi:hypothetical protein